MKRIITHSGHFQPDEVFAVATLSILLEGDYELVRTRDPQIFPSGDYIVDVGGEYDPARGRFDHHQKGDVGKGSLGISLSSFGLVWKEFGGKLASSPTVALAIEKKLVQAIDADDMGIASETGTKVPVYQFVDAIYALVPSWQEPDEMFEVNFKKAVEIAETVLRRELIKADGEEKAAAAVEAAYERAEDKRIIVLDQGYPASEVLAKYPEPLFVVKPARQLDQWKVKAVTVKSDSFEAKKLFPEPWAAKQGKDLQEISGVPDALFCHKNRWVAAARSREGAIALAQRALES